MAFIVEQAGGSASDGSRRILEIQPTELHLRVPIFIGSSEMVRMVEGLIAKHSDPSVGEAVSANQKRVSPGGEADPTDQKLEDLNIIGGID